MRKLCIHCNQVLDVKMFIGCQVVYSIGAEKGDTYLASMLSRGMEVAPLGVRFTTQHHEYDVR